MTHIIILYRIVLFSLVHSNILQLIPHLEHFITHHASQSTPTRIYLSSENYI